MDVQIQPGVRVPAQIARLPEAALSPAIESELVRRSADGRFAGAVLIAKGGVPVHQSAWGLADREQNVPNRLDTRFRNGSMNKMFTAVAVMTLVQAGKVRLEEPIGTYLTAYPNAAVARRVTVHHLLTHTGGTGDVFGPEFAANRDRLRQHQDYVDRFAAQPLLFDPGARVGLQQLRFHPPRRADREGERPQLLRVRARPRLRAGGDARHRVRT